MTLINGINTGIKSYEHNNIKSIILNNTKIEEKLNVIIVLSNASSFASRYILTKEFILRMNNEEPNVNLYIIELAYGNQSFFVTDSNDPMHLQIRTDIPLWHKKNLINIAVQRLLPPNWKAFSWKSIK